MDDHSIFYCFRNRVSQCEDQIMKIAEAKNAEVRLSSTNCMKLCMFCARQYVAIVNKEVVIAKDEDLLMSKISERLT